MGGAAGLWGHFTAGCGQGAVRWSLAGARLVSLYSLLRVTFYGEAVLLFQQLLFGGDAQLLC